MPTTTVKSIGTSSRDYSTITAWAAAAPDLVAGDKIWRGECYNDSEFAEQCIIAGTSSDATRYFDLTTATGQSFQDQAGVRSNALKYDQSKGVGNKKSQAYNQIFDTDHTVFMRVSKIQWQNSAAGNGTACALFGCTGGVVAKDCIFDTNRPLAASAAVIMVGCTLINCVLVQRGNTGAGVQINGNGTMIGCTVVCPSDVLSSGSGLYYVSGTITVQSNAFFGFTTACDAGTYTASKNNATDAASGLPGTSNQHSVTYTSGSPFTGATAAALDLRAVTATTLAANGFLDATNAPLDISGYTRTATPTIGCWEITAAAASAVRHLIALLGVG